MKRITLFILLFFLLSDTTIFAQAHTGVVTPSSKITPTISKAPTTEQDLDRIQKIKEMVAKKVSQLKLVEKRGILGTVKETSNTQIVIEDTHSDSRTIEIDELTKFQENVGSSKTFGISDIKKGDILSFVGLYNKASRRLLARVITRVKTIPEYFEGVVISKSAANYTLDAVNDKGDTRIIDIGISTKTQTFTAESGMVKSGFTKIIVGQRILAAGFDDPKDKKTLLASRIVYFDDSVPPSENMKKYQTATPEASPTPSPSRKITPLIKR